VSADQVEQNLLSVSRAVAVVESVKEAVSEDRVMGTDKVISDLGAEGGNHCPDEGRGCVAGSRGRGSGDEARPIANAIVATVSIPPGGDSAEVVKCAELGQASSRDNDWVDRGARVGVDIPCQ
jgi:hypothetical protein